MMIWYVADKDYVNFLHGIDNKVENIEYGNKLKPYFGIVLNINDIKYYMPVSSPKAKHRRMKNSNDFQKLCDLETGELIAVLNINNMIPIPSYCINELKYNEVGLYRCFKDEKDKKQYVNLLRKELDIINSFAGTIKRKGIYLYNYYKQFPNDKVSKRCCNFPLLESKMFEYDVKQQIAATSDPESKE